jgi:PIN domain nuclease of toxin-antitoxin system
LLATHEERDGDEPSRFTHTLLWWVDDREVEDEGELVVSTMTAWEVILLMKKGRLRLAMDVGGWFGKVSRIAGVRFIPIDRHIALASADLPGDFPSDPADRMIVATARSLSAPLVTKDRQIRSYKHVKTIR